MLAHGPAILSALLLGQGGTEFEAGARVDTRVGEAPTGMKIDSATGQALPTDQFQLMLSATPLLGLHWSDEKGEVHALSATRILWRPSPLFGTRPIFLETLETTLIERPSRRGNFQLNLRGSFGEEDYTSLTQLLPNQPQLPTALTLLTLNATGQGSWRASRRTTLTWLAGALHRRTQDTQTVTVQDVATGLNTTITGPALPTQTLVTATPGLRYTLDRRTSLEGRLTLGEADFQGIQLGTSSDARVNVLTVQPQIGVVDDLSRSHRLRAFAGLTYAAVLIKPNTGREWLPWTPLLRADLDSLLSRSRASTVRSTLAAEVAWFADPVLGAAVLRGTTQVRLDAELGRRWIVGARATFTSDLSKPLVPPVAGGVSPDETVAQLDVPLRYRHSSHLNIEFGARYAERAPNLRASGFAWRNREVWAFFTLFTTTRQTSTRPSTKARRPS